MEAKAGKIWTVALIIGVVAYVILIGLAGYGWFKGLLLAILVVLLVALILLFLWEGDEAVASDTTGQGGTTPPPGAEGGIARAAGGAAAASGTARPDFIPLGSAEGPPARPSADDAMHAHAIPMGETEGPAPHPSADDVMHAHAIPSGEAEGPPPVAARHATPDDGDDEALGEEAANHAPEPPDHGTKYPSGRGAPARAKAGTRTDPRTAPRTAPRAGGKAALKPAAKAKTAAPAAGGGDDLKRIKGVGPKLEATLHGLGITSFSQIAAWTADDVTRVDDALKFQGRIDRDGWIEQAKILAAGGETEFSGRKKR
jgi:predicted flap endonuclease-1-like 5' DNA nuclease